MTSHTTNNYPDRLKHNLLHKTFTGIALLLMLPALLPAQFIKSYIGPSPNAASLGTYGQIPVSEYSGVPDIHIPLYSIETEGFSMPITLNYHAAALKYSDEASWVGLGWSLNAGGVITRSKRDQNDFGANGFFSTTNDRPCGSEVDQEPDMFYYNVGGLSGKFMILGPSSNPVIRYFNRDNIKITYQQGAQTFTLVTGDGVIYFFGKKENVSETTMQGNSTISTDSYISSWYVTSITLVTGTRINFSYLAPNNTRIMQKSNWGETDIVNNYWPTVANTSCCQQAHSALYAMYNIFTTTTHIDEVILSEIEFPNGNIKFNVNPRNDLTVMEGTDAAKKLDNIQVYSVQNGTEQLKKTFSLNYDYYYGNPTKPDNKLRLLSVTESTPGATSKPTLFNYYHNSIPVVSSSNTIFLGGMGILKSIVYPTGGSSTFKWGVVHLDGVATVRIQKIYDRDGLDSFHVRRFEYKGDKAMSEIWSGYTVNYTTNQVINDCCGMTDVTFTAARTRSFYYDFSSLGETANGCLIGSDTVITWFGENGENGKKESIFENTAPYDPNYFQGQVPVPVPFDVSNKNGLLKEEREYSNVNGVFTLIKQVTNAYTSTDIVVTPARRFGFNKCSWTYNITTEWVQLSGQTVSTRDAAGGNVMTASTEYFYDDPDNAQPTRIRTTDSKGNPLLTTNFYTKEKSAQSGGIYTTMLNKHMINPLLEQQNTRNSSIVSTTTTTYKDWYNNGKVIKPETVRVKVGNNTAETAVRYHDYDEHGNILALSKEKGKTVSYIWDYGGVHPVAEITNADHEPKISYTGKSYNVGDFLNLTANSTLNFASFTTNHAQTINFSVRFMPVVTMGTYNGSVEVRLRNKAGGILYTTTLTQDNTYTGSATLPNGTDSYYFTATVNAVGTNTHLVRVEVNASYLLKITNYNYFHTSFEELTSGFVSDGRTGRQCVKGPYTISTDRKPGNYVVSWWQKPVTGGNWTYQEQLITITSGSANVIAGNASLLIDEVRLHPQDAYMTTYTYQPQTGMTSKCDERGQITCYEYDELYRLKVIRDHNNNIVKMIEYNYKNN